MYNYVQLFDNIDLTEPIVTGDTKVIEGQPIKLTCNVTGNSNNIAYKWFMNDTYETIPNQRQRTLSINPSNRDDSGEYSCQATNMYGNRTSKRHEVWVACK